MAILSNSEEKKKKNRVLEFLSKEYKYENLILVILALFAIVLGILMVTPLGVPANQKVLSVNPDFFLIGSFPLVFAWILIALGVLSLLLVVWPFYKPSFAEARHVTGLKRSQFFLNIASVIIYILILAFFFFLIDVLVNLVIKLFS